MAVVYIIDATGDNIIAFDATEEASYSRQNSVTKSSIQSGAKVADGMTLGNKMVTFSGVVSYSKIRDFAPNPRDLEELVGDMIDNYTRFTLQGNHIIPTLEDCVITNFSMVHSKWENAATAVISVEQVNVSNQAMKTSIVLPNPSATTEGQLSSEVNTGSGSKTQQTEQRSRTLFGAAAEKGSEFSQIAADFLVGG